MVVRDYGYVDFIQLFHCLRDPAWAAANWAEIKMAEMEKQLGNNVVLLEYSQQNKT